MSETGGGGGGEASRGSVVRARTEWAGCFAKAFGLRNEPFDAYTPIAFLQTLPDAWLRKPHCPSAELVQVDAKLAEFEIVLLVYFVPFVKWHPQIRCRRGPMNRRAERIDGLPHRSLAFGTKEGFAKGFYFFQTHASNLLPSQVCVACGFWNPDGQYPYSGPVTLRRDPTLTRATTAVVG